MKTTNLKFLFTTLLVVLLISCKNEANTTEQVEAASTEAPERQGQAFIEDDEATPNVLQIAIGSPDHTTLVAAVQAAEIEHVLVNAGPLTVFAPTNEAFAALPEGTVESLLLPENKAALAKILTRHAAPGTYKTMYLKKMSSRKNYVYFCIVPPNFLCIYPHGSDPLVVAPPREPRARLPHRVPIRRLSPCARIPDARASWWTLLPRYI